MKQSHSFADTLRIIILALALSVGIGSAFAAWQPPSGNPPTSNTPPPINVGDAMQTKTGKLNVTNLLSASAGYFASDVGIGTIPSGTDALEVNGSVSVKNNLIHEVATPVDGKDAVNKDYVDAAGGGIVCTSGLYGEWYNECINTQTGRVCYSGEPTNKVWTCYSTTGWSI